MAAASSVSIPHINNLVTVKLTDSNYLIWLSQMKPFLFGQDFWKYIVGSSSPPDQVLPSTKGQPPKSNPEYQSWFCTDQMLISLLRATLSEPILGLVVGLTTSRTIWETLQAHFSQQSVANASQLRSNLFL
ncbi:PREDICTED: UBN2_3 domain-containing [Prunus dulcis]|uniref:PREDICTED: UBN2_3 domain-containing n=1 Tax=Prunus dulcis TaxID=3755 RepID=A0A5E4FRZ8_PRUDU|nr:PREDICTED: UBN2_3 domain-containing [Prunus dulcis]